MKLELEIANIDDAKLAIHRIEEFIKSERVKNNDPEDIEVLKIGVKSKNKLLAVGIKTVGQLAKMSQDEMWETAKIGVKSYNEITAAISKFRGFEVL